MSPCRTPSSSDEGVAPSSQISSVKSTELLRPNLSDDTETPLSPDLVTKIDFLCPSLPAVVEMPLPCRFMMAMFDPIGCCLSSMTATHLSRLSVKSP